MKKIETWLTENKGYCLFLFFAAVLLLFTFWFGGNSPDAQGWSLQDEAQQTAGVLPQEDPQEPPGEEAPAVLPQEAPGEPEEQEPSGAQAAVSIPDETPQSKPAPSPSTAKPSSRPAASSPSKSQNAAYSQAQGMTLDPATGQDQYQTDPVPVGKPVPADPQDTTVTSATHTCTLSISCAAIQDHLDWLDPEKVELLPEDGYLLEPTAVTFYEGENVFQLLQRVCREQGIHMEFTSTPLYNSDYIEGIGNLYEFDCGELSGWMYQVNGWSPNYGSSRYPLEDGDVVEWVYTCNLGQDIGGMA